MAGLDVSSTPSPQPVSSLPKQKKTAWVESQVRIAPFNIDHANSNHFYPFKVNKDQQEALNPNYNAPFKTKDDACKRLLRYHVFYELDCSPMELEESDQGFESKSDALLAKFHGMRDKYHFLLLHESRRPAASSEEVMLARMWDTDERQNLAQERDEYKSGKIFELPPLPPTWAERYKEVFGSEPPPGVALAPESPPASEKEEPQVESQDIVEEEPEKTLNQIVDDPEPEQEPESDESKALKFSFHRSTSGSWVPKKKKKKKRKRFDDDEATTSQSSFMEGDDSTRGDDDEEDEDDDFTLNDFDDPSNAVHSIMENEDEGVNDDFADINFGQAAMNLGSDNESAINSILDMQRMETPDLNNIAGLLDSIGEVDEDVLNQERDPVTEAAVNSIPRF